MMKTSKFLKFWTPLALMQLVMNFEFPAVIAFISRVGDVKETLAVFTVVTSLSLLLEGPIIQMLSATTALADSWNNYSRVKHFLYVVLTALVAIQVVCVIPGPFNWMAQVLFKLDDSCIHSARISFILMLPWVPAIGLRRMWQGVLIRNGHTVQASMITFIRLAVTLGVLAPLAYCGTVRGSYAASIALSLGVTSGAISAYIFARPLLKSMRTSISPNTISWKDLFFFYLPLAMTSFVTEADRPIIAAGISRGLFPIESLAVWSVVISFISIFRGVCYSTQEASITLNDAKNAVFKCCSVVCAFCALCVFTPACRSFVLLNLSGLTKELADFTAFPLMLITAVIITFPAIAWLRAVNIKNKTTKNIGVSVCMNLAAVSISIFVMNMCFTLSGIVIAAVSYICAMYAEALYLLIKTDKS